MSFLAIARMGGRQAPYENLPLNDFKGGLNTVLPPSKLRPNELYAALNVQYSQSFGLETRPGLIKYTATAFPAEVKYMEKCQIGATSYELAVTSEYKLYNIPANKIPSLLTTLVGDATILPFSGVAILMDGSYLKYYNGTSVLLCYDDGSGSRGFQVDQLGLTQNDSIIVGNATNTRVGVKFTTQTWDTGYTIPITRVSAYLKKVLAPTGTAVAKIYKVSDGSLIATSTTTLDVSTLVTSAYTLNEFEFDLSVGFALNTAYYAAIVYSGGDAANHILVATETKASGGNSSYYDGSWHDVTTESPVMGVQPGRPPKAKFGQVKASRLFLAGDTDNPGWVWFGNANSYLDFSTSNGGGSFGAVDGNANNYAVGALVAQYGNLYVFGTKDQPYLASLTGTSPTDYAIGQLFNGVWGTHRTSLSVVNDVWFTGLSGAQALSGVQEFGDLRTFTESESVKNIISQYFTSSAVCGYNPLQGQYFIKLAGYHKVLCGHTKNPVQSDNGTSYPWTEFAFTRERLTDTAIYKWTASGHGTNEYYAELLAGGDPSLQKPHLGVLNDRLITEGTVGSLTNLEWDYADNDTLGYSTVYIRLDAGDPDVAGYEITTILEPYAFGSWDEKFFVAGDNGHIYYFSPTITRDNGIENRYLVATSYISPPFGTICLERYSLKAFSQLGADIDLSVYKDYSTVTAAATQSLNVADSVTVADLDEVEVRDANFVITTEPDELWNWLNINAKAFMIVLHDFSTRNTPIYFDGIYLETRSVGR